MVSEHLFDLDLEELLDNTASGAIDVWMRVAKPDDSSSKAVDSITVDSAAAALTCFNAGASLYCLSTQQMADEYIGALAVALGMNFGGFRAAQRGSSGMQPGQVRGEIEVFVSREGHTTDWHWDFQHNFTIQLSGRKRWRLKQSSISHPLRGCTPHYASGSGNEEQQLKLHRMQDPECRFRPPPAFFESAEEVRAVPHVFSYTMPLTKPS